MFKHIARRLTGPVTALLLTACSSPNQADSIYINTSISGELMPGVYGQVNIGSVPDYVTVYEEPMLIMPQPVYAVPLQPIYLYVPPYHAYHWRDHCSYYNACARPVYFVCARDYRPHYFESRYYSSRHYDPPRVYGQHHSHGHDRDNHNYHDNRHDSRNHNRSYETMHQREMNRDANYRGVGENRSSNGHRSYVEQNRVEQNRIEPNRTEPNRGNGVRTEPNRIQDNRRQDNRHDGKRDDANNRQQLINNDRNNTYNNNRSFNQRNETRPASYTRPAAQSHQNGGNVRERAQMPVQQQARQPAFRPQQQEQRSSGNRQGGGNDNRRREDRRER
jgi:hypothetical protein